MYICTSHVLLHMLVQIWGDSGQRHLVIFFNICLIFFYLFFCVCVCLVRECYFISYAFKAYAGASFSSCPFPLSFLPRKSPCLFLLSRDFSFPLIVILHRQLITFPILPFQSLWCCPFGFIILLFNLAPIRG